MNDGQFGTKPGFYPHQANAYSAGFQAVQPVYIPPPVYSAVNQPRSVLFNVAKYYIVIKNSIVFGAVTLVLFLLLLSTIAAAFSKSPEIGLVFLLLDGLVGCVALYLWKVPIRGALDEKPTHMIVHGVLLAMRIVSIIGILINLENMNYSGLDQQTQNALKQLAQQRNFIGVLVFSALEMLSCFHVAQVAKQTPKETLLLASVHYA